MRVFVGIFLLAGMVACGSEADVKKAIDTLGRKVDTALHSPTMDSIKAKGKRILDSVESKGGKLIDKAEEKWKDLGKDTTK